LLKIRRHVMPMFEYRCGICENAFEELVRSAAAEAEVACPECGSHEVEKKMSTFGFSVAGAKTVSSSAGSGCDSCRGGNCSSCGR